MRIHTLHYCSRGASVDQQHLDNVRYTNTYVYVRERERRRRRNEPTLTEANRIPKLPITILEENTKLSSATLESVVLVSCTESRRCFLGRWQRTNSQDSAPDTNMWTPLRVAGNWKLPNTPLLSSVTVTLRTIQLAKEICGRQLPLRCDSVMGEESVTSGTATRGGIRIVTEFVAMLSLSNAAVQSSHTHQVLLSIFAV